MTPQPPAFDADLAHADWQALEQLLDDLAALSRQPSVTPAIFYRTLLERLVAALDAASGGIWSAATSASVRLAHQHARQPRAGQLARGVLDQRSAAAATALRENRLQCGAVTGWNGGNAWLVVHPATCDGAGTERMAIEILTTHDMTAAGSQDHLRVLAATSELIDDFERRRELRSLRAAANCWREYEQFAQQVHRSLDIEQTAFAIANEARRLIGCDRVSVLEARGRAARTAAVSGVDTLDRRAPAIRALEQLGRSTARYGEPIWYYDGADDLPDELLAPLEAYLEHAHARMLAIVPLHEPGERAAGEHDSPGVIGLLVAEHFHGTTSPDTFRDRLLAVAGHTAAALHNAQTHTRMPLAGASRALRRMGWFVRGGQLPKTTLAGVALAAAGAILALAPADFAIEAQGELQPRERREVFAAEDGVVADLLVTAGQTVAADEPLIQLRNPALDLELRRVLGEYETAERQLASVRAERLQDRPSAVDQRRRDPHELAAEEEELKSSLASLAAQQKILEARLAALVIRSPIAGQTLTWNIEQLLAARPVERGQALLSVANVDGPWDLRLRVPDDRAGYVVAARDELGPTLDVQFMVTSDPHRTIQGQLTKLAISTELDVQQASTVAGTVTFDRAAVKGLRPGATAVAKVHCGRRSLGFVWFHDVFDYLRSWWW